MTGWLFYHNNGEQRKRQNARNLQHWEWLKYWAESCRHGSTGDASSADAWPSLRGGDRATEMAVSGRTENAMTCLNAEPTRDTAHRPRTPHHAHTVWPHTHTHTGDHLLRRRPLGLATPVYTHRLAQSTSWQSGVSKTFQFRLCSLPTIWLYYTTYKTQNDFLE